MAAEQGCAVVTCRAGKNSAEHEEGGRAADGTLARRAIRSQLRCRGFVWECWAGEPEPLVDGGEEELVNGFSSAAVQTVNDQGDEEGG